MKWSVPRLRQHVPATEASLRRALEGYLNGALLPRLGLETIPALTLEEVETMLAERIDEWNRQVEEKGLQKGLQEGEASFLLRLLEKKFGPVRPGDRDRIATADPDILQEWLTAP